MDSELIQCSFDLTKNGARCERKNKNPNIHNKLPYCTQHFNKLTNNPQSKIDEESETIENLRESIKLQKDADKQLLLQMKDLANIRAKADLADKLIERNKVLEQELTKLQEREKLESKVSMNTLIARLKSSEDNITKQNKIIAEQELKIADLKKSIQLITR